MRDGILKTGPSASHDRKWVWSPMCHLELSEGTASSTVASASAQDTGLVLNALCFLPLLSLTLHLTFSSTSVQPDPQTWPHSPGPAFPAAFSGFWPQH